MQEEFLHFIWKNRRFDPGSLRSTRGETIHIFHPGRANADAGPDFCEAQISIDGTTWIGQVEIHLKASDWLRHGHQHDPAYANVILHVVLDADIELRRSDGSRIPCLEMRRRLSPRLLGRYRLLQAQEGSIPCHAQWPGPDTLEITAWLDRLLVQRLQHRVNRLRSCLEGYKGDWEQTFYRQLARSFGSRVNADPFEELADRVPLRLLRKHRDNLFHMEALLFGQAGLLADDLADPYPRKLKAEYAHLKRKYGLKPLPGLAWKFMRMRPNNFPTLRIAQFAALHFQGDALFNKMLAAADAEEVGNMFSVRLANYWKDHYHFDKPAPASPKRLGKDAVRLIAINAVAPILFLYGREQGKVRQEEKAIELLEALPPERNRVIRQWEDLGISFRSAGQTQAALEWRKSYCDKRRCLECAVGQMILR